jgi:hypothetical protein
MAIARKTHWVIQETVTWVGTFIAAAALGYVFVGRAYVTVPPPKKLSVRALVAADRGDSVAVASMK